MLRSLFIYILLTHHHPVEQGSLHLCAAGPFWMEVCNAFFDQNPFLSTNQCAGSVVSNLGTADGLRERRSMDQTHHAESSGRTDVSKVGGWGEV